MTPNRVVDQGMEIEVLRDLVHRSRPGSDGVTLRVKVYQGNYRDLSERDIEAFCSGIRLWLASGRSRALEM